MTCKSKTAMRLACRVEYFGVDGQKISEDAMRVRSASDLYSLHYLWVGSPEEVHSIVVTVEKEPGA